MFARDPEGGKLAAVMLFAIATGLFGTDACADAGADWTIQPPAQGASLATGATLEIGVPADLSAGQIARLGIEVDNIDVTALAHIGEGKIVYTPPQPLAAGPHELRVIEYAGDGHLLARGQWKFTATSSATGKDSSKGWRLAGNVGATVSERVAQSNLTPPAPSRLTANGTFDVKAVRSTSEWTAEVTVKGLYGSDNGTSAVAGQGLQPAQMQVAIKHQKNSLILGDQTIPFDNLLISGLSRRGVSAHVADMPLGADATAFSVRDSSVAGFYGGLGVADSNDNVSGALVQSHPFQETPKALTLLAGFVTGTSPGGLSTAVPYPGANGTFPPNVPGGTVVPVQSGSGNAWVVGLNSQIPRSSLQLDGQFARSSFDFPGTSGQGATRADDNAQSFGVNYSYPLGQQWTLAANALYQNIGTFFSSLANPTLTPDRRTATGRATVSGQGLALAGSGGFTQDNTDSNAAIATVRSLPRSLTASYGPALPSTVTNWLGAPSISLSRQDARTYNVTVPAGVPRTDSDIVNNNAALNFSYPHFFWQTGLTSGSFRDYTGQQDNTDNLGPSLGMNIVFGDAGSVGWNVQFVNTHDLQQDTHTVDHNYSLTAADSFWSNKVSAQLNLTINHNTQQIVPGMIPPQLVGTAITLKTATAQFTWHALPATSTRGGLDVGLSSSWNDSSGLNTAVLTSQGFSSLATRGYQTFLTLSTKWPLGRGDQ